MLSLLDQIQAGRGGVLKLLWIAAILLGIWLILVLLGKGGFIHLFLLSAIGVAFVDVVGICRSRMTA